MARNFSANPERDWPARDASASTVQRRDGIETTRALTGAGAHVIVPARNREKAERTLAGIDKVDIASMDLADPASVTAFADQIVAAGMPVSILVNSAGVMATPLARDQAGHESQFATNHLGHFRLVAGLWPALIMAGNARVISVSSRGHQIGPVDFADVDFKTRPYDKWQAYGQAKTANALFALALDRRGAALGVRAFSLHPGVILTDLARHLSEDEINSFDVYDENGNRRIAPSRDLKTPEQGGSNERLGSNAARTRRYRRCLLRRLRGRPAAGGDGWHQRCGALGHGSTGS